MKINLGCGEDYKEGYVNCDNTYQIKIDKLTNLEKELPFEDNSVDKIVAYHVLEHINNLVPLIKEMHRICRDGAIIKVKVPFYNSPGANTDPTHARSFSVDSFDSFSGKNNSWQIGVDKEMFSINSDIIYSTGKCIRILNPIFNIFVNLSKTTQRLYQKFLSGIIIADEIEFELRIIK